jgi:transcriptional regulator with XRE-family HTH domain
MGPINAKSADAQGRKPVETMRRKPTFGQAVTTLRRERGMNQKELAARIRRETGAPISATYLNDIEHDRRSPSSDHLIHQMADALGTTPSFLTFIAGTLPVEIRDLPLDEERLRRAIEAFRREAEHE